MVVPVLGSQQCRHSEGDNGCECGGELRITTKHIAHNISYSQYAQAYPYTEGVERSRIYIISLTRLRRAGVEIYHQCNTHHNEEPHHHREVLLVAVKLIYQAQQAEHKWQEEVTVACRVVSHFAWQVALRAQISLVESGDAREPVAVQDGLVACLNVVLTSHEVPEEVTPVHIVELIGEEVIKVLTKCRLNEALARNAVIYLATKLQYLASHSLAVFVTHNLAVLITQYIGLCAVGCPRLVCCLALGCVPQAWEEVLELRWVGVARKRYNLVVLLGLGVVVI